MMNFSISTCRARVLAIVFGLACAPCVLAQHLPFAGRWLPDDDVAAPAAYASLSIDAGSMTWRGPTRSAPTCVQQFVLKKEAPGTVYANGHGTRFLAGVPGSLPTYLLELGAGTCGASAEEARISFPLVYDTNHIELIDYVKGKPVSARRFRRKK